MSSHHAYLVTGDIEQGIEAALAFARETMGLETVGNPNVLVLRYGLFSVEDARNFQNAVMRAPTKGDRKVIIASATRFFWEAQNALLKAFEEPPQGTVLILVLPTEGIVLPTLRSRLIALPCSGAVTSPITEEYLAASAEARSKLVAKLLDRAKSDKDAEKAAARADAVALIEGLTRTVYAKAREKSSPELLAFLADLDRFMPLMHDASAPLKLIFEHLMLVHPRGLALR